MKNPIFPAIVFMLILWASIAIMTALLMTTGKLVVTLWKYLNPQQQPISTAAILAPIFEPIPALKSVIATAGKKPKATLVNLIREEAARKVS
jgi:hypothetical protein